MKKNKVRKRLTRNLNGSATAVMRKSRQEAAEADILAAEYNKNSDRFEKYRAAQYRLKKNKE
jgi:hypothetical protein